MITPLTRVRALCATRSKINSAVKTPVVFLRGSFFCLLVLGCFFLTGCATLTGSLNPQAKAEQIAGENAFTKEKVPAGIFALTAFSRLRKPGAPLMIYIEGDGRAWLSKSKIADDPTPFHPMLLELAAKDPAANVVYLARPCQYDNSAFQKPCAPEYWSNKRFSEEVIASESEAVSIFAKKAQAGEIHLIGYSGGGAVAALVAERRQDIKSLKTFAGNLDPEEVNRVNHVDTLEGSLNPMDSASTLRNLPQVHFIGNKDPVIPDSAANRFAARVDNARCAKIIHLEGVTHQTGWENQKERLFLTPVCD